MEEASLIDSFVPAPIRDPRPIETRGPSRVIRYGTPVVLVVLATVLASVAQRLTSAPQVTLIYVLPVIISASFAGWGPSLLAVFLGTAAFDYFFTEPYYSLDINDPGEIWAAVLLLVIALIVAAIATQARRRALDAMEAAQRADSLQALAHAVITSQSQPEIFQLAATALHQVFRAPAIIYAQEGAELRSVGSAGGARDTKEDSAAARSALEAQVNTRGETYPNHQTHFDFWPFAGPDGITYVLGVDFAHAARERPVSTGADVEAVAAYIASARSRSQTAA